MERRSLTTFEIKITEHAIRKMKEKGWRYIDIATHLGVSESRIKQIASCNAAFKLRQINQLAEMFECSPKDFLPEQYISEDK